MNYKAQLKGWCVDRAIEASKAGLVTGDILDYADKLSEYCYVADKDLDDHIAYTFELVRNYADEQKIDAIIGTLEHIKDDLVRNKAVEH